MQEQNKLLAFFDLDKPITWRTEILAGLAVAMTMIPESLSFAILAGFPPLAGLYAAFIAGLVAALFGGRPGLISGGAGATVVTLIALIQSHGLEYAFAAVALAGVIQIIIGIFKWAKYIRLVPESVMYGFVNGLAVIIFSAQIQQFFTTDAGGQKVLLQGSAMLTMATLVAITVAITFLFPKITKKFPSSLAAIIVVFAIVLIFGIDTKTVGDISPISGTLPPFHIPSIPLTWDTFKLILPYSAVVAALAIILIVLVGAPVIERIPMAALTGVMMVVSFFTFNWKSFKILNKMPLQDVLVMVIVTAITIIWHNLALAVLVGIVISALSFAWKKAIGIQVRTATDADGRKRYMLHGDLFFGSIGDFEKALDVKHDPAHVVIDLQHSSISDMGALESLNKMTGKYQAVGKTLVLENLDAQSQALLQKAANLSAVRLA